MGFDSLFSKGPELGIGEVSIVGSKYRPSLLHMRLKNLCSFNTTVFRFQLIRVMQSQNRRIEPFAQNSAKIFLDLCVSITGGQKQALQLLVEFQYPDVQKVCLGDKILQDSLVPTMNIFPISLNFPESELEPLFGVPPAT